MKRRQPRDDAGETIMMLDAVVGLIDSLLIAGVGTTKNFIALATRELLSHFDRWEEIRADPSLLANALRSAYGCVRPGVARGASPLARCGSAMSSSRKRAQVQILLFRRSATIPSSQIPTGSISIDRTRAGTTPLAARRTCASVPISLGPRRG